MRPEPDFGGWTPVRVAWRGGRPRVEWCHTEGAAFTDLFFADTVRRCRADHFRPPLRRETTMEEVGRFVDHHPGLPPAGLVFHMSRCGSTLVSQMLGAAPEHLVLSEPAPVDSVLRAHQNGSAVTDEDRSRWLRWMVAALGQSRPPRRRLFVKFDAWSVTELATVRRAFPDVPWLFLFRAPVAVLASHARLPGAHVVPGVLPPEVLGVAFPVGDPNPLTGYAARALARICAAALAWKDDPGITFVDYSRLPDFVVGDLLAAWSLSVTGEGVARMRHAAGRDAKNPNRPFKPRSAQEKAEPEPEPELRAAADRWLMPEYERLLAVSGGRGGVRAG